MSVTFCRRVELQGYYIEVDVGVVYLFATKKYSELDNELIWYTSTPIKKELIL